MKRKKKTSPSVQFGASLMLVVFIVLCLTVFAVLSVSGALRSYEYSKRSAQKTAQYYAADTESRHKAAQIDRLLAETYRSYPDAYLEHAPEALADVADITVDTQDATNISVSWQTEMNDRQALTVRLALYRPEALAVALSAAAGQSSADYRFFRVTRWKEISTKEWNSDTKLPVIGSD